MAGKQRNKEKDALSQFHEMELMGICDYHEEGRNDLTIKVALIFYKTGNTSISIILLLFMVLSHKNVSLTNFLYQ